MTRSTRARIRRRRWLTAIIATLIAAVGAQLALVLTAGATTSLTWSGATATPSGGDPSAAASRSSSARDTQAGQHGTATVTVEVNGLPRHVSANVKLTGPGKKSRRITATTKLTGVVPGTYTVSAQSVVWHASSYHPTISLCSASGRCSPPSHGRITVKAHQHVTVHVTYAVPKPITAPSSASPVGSPQPSPEGKGTLGSNKSESGIWSATISEPAGAPQTQVDAVVSLPIPLAEEEKIKITYRNEAQALEPKAPCIGSPNEPVAEPGNLCVYRGDGSGSKESEDKNAKFFDFQDALGDSIASGTETKGAGGHTGILIVFRTDEFNAAGKPVTLANEARLTASGSWSLTAK
jgi:hypothetical protein